MNNIVHKHSIKINKSKVFIDRKKSIKSGYIKHLKRDWVNS